ncbi:hypothetical protein N476_14625 [Pseudoalteromonas luteoviolacea H33]|uniref:Uncharacterized protein n=1 Tax=Pseudoalteromonas luteoviolacea H33 TaxID=1365251 RepID=A0A167EK28_9GAMM|nr:hypothetical protein N476_14625 [Pseudoalteromonas luteoviolacea H33]KZN74946.1 hypothetical protein N477_20260 [Pseudoalteromonas luteoviolacea H33-S]
MKFKKKSLKRLSVNHLQNVKGGTADTFEPPQVLRILNRAIDENQAAIAK